MHIAILNQYYPPDLAPTGQLAADFARYLANQGHQVTIFCGRPRTQEGRGQRSKPENAVTIKHCWATPLKATFASKLIHYATFYLSLSWRLLFSRPRPDVIVAMTTPPYLGLLACLVAKTRSCHAVDWVMDLYPDVLAASGQLRKGRFPYRALAALNRLYLSSNALAITLGPDMAQRIEAYSRKSAVKVVPLWIKNDDDGKQPTPESIVAYRKLRGWEGKTVFLYSGNLGMGHDFDLFFRAIEATASASRRAHWVFCGRGARLREVRERIGVLAGAPVEWLDHVDAETLPAHLAAGDVHLASLEPQWEGCMVPSKLQAAFGAGKPLIAVAPRESSLSLWIRESRGGWAVEPRDFPGLDRAVNEALDFSLRQSRGTAAKAAARTHFSLSLNLRAMESVIMEIRSESSKVCSAGA